MKLCRAMDIAFVFFLFANWAAAERGRNNLSACFDLTDSCADWQAGFADYPAGQESYYELTAQCGDDSTNLNPGYFLSGANHSDDLFMFIKRPICGLKPADTYVVEASVWFLSKAPAGCIGGGGDPGAGVYVKFGASAVEPAPALQPDGMLRMNVDKGNQSLGGANAAVIGDITTSSTNCFNEQYELKELRTSAPLITPSDENGTLWIFVGTDSGFEGRTSLYYTRVSVHLHRAKAKAEAETETSTNNHHRSNCESEDL
jgi:hypothetical protein